MHSYKWLGRVSTLSVVEPQLESDQLSAFIVVCSSYGHILLE